MLLAGKLSARDFPSIAIRARFPASLSYMRQHLFESVVTAASDVHEKWFFVRCSGKCLLLFGSYCCCNLLCPEVSAKRKTENSSFCYKLKCCQHLHATCGIFGQEFTLKFIIYFLLQRIFRLSKQRETKKDWPAIKLKAQGKTLEENSKLSLWFSLSNL